MERIMHLLILFVLVVLSKSEVNWEFGEDSPELATLSNATGKIIHGHLKLRIEDTKCTDIRYVFINVYSTPGDPAPPGFPAITFDKRYRQLTVTYKKYSKRDIGRYHVVIKGMYGRQYKNRCHYAD